jgi:hypothetical protein
MRFYAILLFLIALVSGCTSTSQVIRPAPKEGIQVVGLNVLFSISPINSIQTSGTRTPASTKNAVANDQTKPRVQAEKLRDQIGSTLIPQLQAKGIASNYASVQIIPGIAPTPLNKLFPADYDTSHTLIITPVTERETCYGGSCATMFSLSLSLRSPKENKEIWNLRLHQGSGTAADWMPGRHDQLINDIAKSVLQVVASN